MVTSPRRRTFLGTVAAASATSGCLAELNALARGQRRPLSVTIVTSAPDTDPYAPAIARRLATALEAAGVRTTLLPTSESNLWREVLINGTFDLYVGRLPIDPDPDVLRELFHSRYAEEVGWQNHTGVADPDLDDLLDRQRHESGDKRVETVRDVLESIGELEPIAPLTVPFDLRIQRTDDEFEWGPYGVRNALTYVGLESPHREEVRVGIAADHDRWNLNPLWVERRDRTTIVDLLYDRLAVREGGNLHPWLATGWEIEAGRDGGSVITVRLREAATWHDGTPIRPEDVAFTYRLLDDTSHGSPGPPIPSVTYRGRSSLVEAVQSVGKRTARITVDAGRRHALNVLTVPVLPKHVWRTRRDRGRSGVSELLITEAIITPNDVPVGSGPYQYLESDRTRLLLGRTEGHFLDDDPRGFAGQVAAVSPPDRLEFAALGSRDMARVFIRQGDLDAATVAMSPAEFDRMQADSLVESIDARSQSVYAIGFNFRRYPMSTPGFRNVVSQLVDRAHVSKTVFGGRARPTTSIGPQLLDGRGARPWTSTAPSRPYLGAGGEIDAERARDAFRDEGFVYSEQDRLLVRR